MLCGHLKYKNSAKLDNNFNIFCQFEGIIFCISFNDPYSSSVCITYSGTLVNKVSYRYVNI